MREILGSKSSASSTPSRLEEISVRTASTSSSTRSKKSHRFSVLRYEPVQSSRYFVPNAKASEPFQIRVGRDDRICRSSVSLQPHTQTARLPLLRRAHFCDAVNRDGVLRALLYSSRQRLPATRLVLLRFDGSSKFDLLSVHLLYARTSYMRSLGMVQWY